MHVKLTENERIKGAPRYYDFQMSGITFTQSAIKLNNTRLFIQARCSYNNNIHIVVNHEETDSIYYTLYIHIILIMLYMNIN